MFVPALLLQERVHVPEHRLANVAERVFELESALDSGQLVATETADVLDDVDDDVLHDLQQFLVVDVQHALHEVPVQLETLRQVRDRVLQVRLVVLVRVRVVAQYHREYLRVLAGSERETQHQQRVQQHSARCQLQLAQSSYLPDLRVILQLEDDVGLLRHLVRAHLLRDVL